MSDSNRLIEQLERAARNSSIDPSLIEYLYEAIKAVLGESGGIDPKRANLAEITANYEKIRRLIDENKAKLEGTVDSEELLMESYEEELDVLKERIVYVIQNGEAYEGELQMMRDRFKELKKVTKEYETHQKGMAKGEAAAEQLMQATFGISKGWEDISAKGLAKGYLKGLMQSLSFSNVLASLTSKIFETMLRFDKAAAQMFEKAQISREDLDVGRVASEMGDIGVNLEGVAADAAAALKQNFMSFGELTTGKDSQLELLAKGMGVMSKLGVSMEDQAEFLGTQMKTFGKSPEEANALLQGMTGMAQALARPPAELVAEFNKAQPILARFEDELGRKIFKATMFEATKLNIEASKLLSISEGMDTIAGATAMAQSLNIAFNGNFISAYALLGAKDINERRKIIMDSLRAAGKSVNDLTERELRGLAQSPAFSQFGNNVAELRRFLGEGAETFSAEREGMDELGTSMQDNQKLVAENLSVGQKLDAKFQEAINKLVTAIGGEGGIVELVNGIVYVIDSIADNLNAFAVLVAGLAVGKFLGPAGGTAAGLLTARTLGMTAGGMGADPVKAQQDAIKKEEQAKVQGATAKAQSQAAASADTQANNLKKITGSIGNVKGSTKTTQGSSVTTNKAGTETQGVAYGTVTVKQDGFGFSDDGSGTTAPMVQPDISRQYVQPVFHKNDHFYAAKSDGAMAKALDEIIDVVNSLMNKNSNLKLSISERGFGYAVEDGLNAIKRF